MCKVRKTRSTGEDVRHTLRYSVTVWNVRVWVAVVQGGRQHFCRWHIRNRGGTGVGEPDANVSWHNTCANSTCGGVVCMQAQSKIDRNLGIEYRYAQGWGK